MDRGSLHNEGMLRCCHPTPRIDSPPDTLKAARGVRVSGRRAGLEEQKMSPRGLVYAKILLKNLRKAGIKPIEVEALVDSGVLHLCIPRYLQVQLKLEEIDKKEVMLADGTKKLVPYAGPVEIRFKNRVGFAGRYLEASARIGRDEQGGCDSFESSHQRRSFRRQAFLQNLRS